MSSDDKKFYQLIATGSLAVLDGSNKIASRKIFTDYAKAEAYISEFRQLVITPMSEYDLTHLEDNKILKIGIVELELQE